MRTLTVIVSILLSYQFAWASENIDSTFQKIRETSHPEKLKLWEDIANNPTKDNVLEVYNHLNDAYSDAVDWLGRDSAIIWNFELKGNLVNELQKNGYGQQAILILDQLKLTADSLSNVKGELHPIVLDYYYFIGHFYYKQVDMDRAEELFLKGLKLNETIQHPAKALDLYLILGLLKTYVGDYEEAIKYYSLTDGIIIHPSIPKRRRFSVYKNKAYLYNKMEQFVKADSFYKIAVDNISIFNSKSFTARLQTDYAANLCDMGKVSDCVKYLEDLKSIFLEEDNPNIMLTFSEKYSDALMLAGRFEDGKIWTRKVREYYYDIQETRRKDEVQEWQAKYQIADKETEIKELEQEKIISKSRMINIGLFGTVISGLLLFFLYVNKNKQRRLAIELDGERRIIENRDRLFSSITHDIRTPLALILGPLERLFNSVKEQQQKEDILIARRNGERLLELFNQILDWNKAESKAFSWNPQAGQLSYSFDLLSQRFQQQCAEKGIKFSYHSSIPEDNFLLDYDKVDKVLSNLIGNAVKFCKVGDEVKLNTDLKLINNKNVLILEVSDQGPGIGIDERKNIFKRFVQGEQGKSNKGVGIGLALVKELVDIMHGNIQLESELGDGAKFTVHLPVEPIQKDQLETQNIIIEDDLNNAEKPLILVVEDEPDLLNFLKSNLEQNYQVKIANTTTAGLNIALTNIPDIIISDWVLPDNNGGWLCKQVVSNELTCHIPIVILTAHTKEEQQKEAYDSGAMVWMNKPFQISVLNQQIETILKHQKRNSEKVHSKFIGKALTTTLVADENLVADPFLVKIQGVIAKNYSDVEFTIDKMATMLSLSRTQLFRKVKSTTGDTPGKILNEYRLNKARYLLQTSGLSVSEICFQVGFSDPSYFGRAYKKYFQVTPSQDMGMGN